MRSWRIAAHLALGCGLALAGCSWLYDPAALAYCGDGQVEGDEQCDDGNSEDHDACPRTCRRATCGDGLLRRDLPPEHDAFEECDPPGSMDEADRLCGSACRWATCADGQYRRASVSYPPESCNLRDDDCDGTVLEEQPYSPLDCDSDGASPAQGDCDDGQVRASPAYGFELDCGDGIDNDCDGAADAADPWCPLHPGWGPARGLSAQAIVHALERDGAGRLLLLWADPEAAAPDPSAPSPASLDAAGLLALDELHSGQRLLELRGAQAQARLGHAAAMLGGRAGELLVALLHGPALQLWRVPAAGQAAPACSLPGPFPDQLTLHAGVDLSGDGRAELLLRAPAAESQGLPDAGCVWAVAYADGSSACQIRGLCGSQALDRLGAQVHLPGDLSGDGRPDLLLASPAAAPGGLAGAGSLWLIDGASWWAGGGALRLDGSAGQGLGGRLAWLDGDSETWLASAPAALPAGASGAIWWARLGRAPLHVRHDALIDGGDGWRLGAQLHFLARALGGQVPGLAVTAPGKGAAGSTLWLDPRQPASGALLGERPGLSPDGDRPDQALLVRGPGGRVDLALGAPGAASSAGRVWLLGGPQLELLATITGGPGQALGHGLLATGDADQDGTEDLLALADTARNPAGAAALVSGAARGDSQARWLVAGEPGAGLGATALVAGERLITANPAWLSTGELQPRGRVWVLALGSGQLLASWHGPRPLDRLAPLAAPGEGQLALRGLAAAAGPGAAGWVAAVALP